MFFIQVVRGRPGGHLQFSWGGGLKMAWLASAFSTIRARCPKKVRRRDLTTDKVVAGWQCDGCRHFWQSRANECPRGPHLTMCLGGVPDPLRKRALFESHLSRPACCQYSLPCSLGAAAMLPLPKKDLLRSVWVKIFKKSVNIWQRYKQDCGCHFARRKCTRQSRSCLQLACRFKKNSLTDSAINLS